jgi:hypothetical protein
VTPQTSFIHESEVALVTLQCLRPKDAEDDDMMRTNDTAIVRMYEKDVIVFV